MGHLRRRERLRRVNIFQVKLDFEAKTRTEIVARRR